MALVLNNIEVTNPNLNPLPPTSQLIQVTSGDSSGFQPTVDSQAATATTVRVLNTGNSDIILEGTIDNPLGATTITDTGGSILTSGSAESILTGQLALDSVSGSIGAAAQRVAATLYQTSDGTPQFQATAPGGNVYLSLAAIDETSGALQVTSSALTGKVIDLKLGGGKSQTGGAFEPDERGQHV